MRVVVDMDGVVADWISSARVYTKEFFGIDVEFEEITGPKFASILKGKLRRIGHSHSYSSDEEIYKIISGFKGFYLNLEPYEGSIDAIKQIQRNGHNIVFCTKPTGWDVCSYEKVQWLRKHFSSIPYEIIMVSSMEAKHMVYTPVLIEDDPRALKDHPSAIPVCIARPWNKEFRDNGEVGMIVVDDMRDLPRQIEFVHNLVRDKGHVVPF